MSATDPTPVPETTADELADRYGAILLDAYGVLVDASGALPGAPELVGRLRARGRALLVVTNDASRLPETAAARFRSFGIDVGDDEVITSGSLLGPYFDQRGLSGARAIVLGTEDSVRYVERAGGRVVPATEDADCDVIAVCDDDGYPFLPTIENTMSALYRLIDGGRVPHLVLPNPDLIYPKTAGSFGFTSGAVALLLEAALDRRYPDESLRFERLGKPHAPMFDEALRRAGTGQVVMIGDQLETDIAGAVRAGIDAALLTTGVTRWRGGREDEARPSYLLRSL